MKAFHEIRNYASDFKVWQSSYTDISFLAHWHKEVELIYVRSGSARISVSDVVVTAYEGDLIVCGSGNIHYSDSYDMDNVLDFIIFDPGIISSSYENSNLDYPLLSRQQLETLGLTENIYRLFSTVAQELKMKKPYYQDIVKASIREFWYLLKRNLPDSNIGLPNSNRRNNLLYELQQLLTYLDDNYAESITLSFAAEKMNFSESHFSKVFKKLTGINFVTYLNMIRIEQAASQLKNTTKKITDIALSCGFNNIRTFNRVFKEITGYSPSDFNSLADTDSYNLTYYKRKSLKEEYVENDSLTLIQNQKT